MTGSGRVPERIRRTPCSTRMVLSWQCWRRSARCRSSASPTWWRASCRECAPQWASQRVHPSQWCALPRSQLIPSLPLPAPALLQAAPCEILSPRRLIAHACEGCTTTSPPMGSSWRFLIRLYTLNLTFVHASQSTVTAEDRPKPLYHSTACQLGLHKTRGKLLPWSSLSRGRAPLQKATVCTDPLMCCLLCGSIKPQHPQCLCMLLSSTIDFTIIFIDNTATDLEMQP